MIEENDEQLLNETQLSVAIINDQEIEFKGISVRNDSTFEIDNSDQLFEIGSLTKVLASSVFAKMANEYKIKPNDKVFKYLKYKSFRDKELRIKHFLNHTSGLPRLPSNMDLQSNFLDPYATYGDDQLHEYLTKECQLSTAPGEKFEYSNIGMALLTEIMKKQTKLDFKSLMTSYLFKPLKMGNTYTFVENAPSIIEGIGPNGQKINNWHFKSLAPAGSIVSCTQDLVKLANSYLQETSIYDILLDSTFQLSPNMNIGLGWFMIKKEKQTNNTYIYIYI